MALIITTPNSHEVLHQFMQQIAGAQIKVWEYNKARNCFLYKVDQYTDEARFETVIYQNRLYFLLFSEKEEDLNEFYYGLFNGRLAESILTHLRGLFTGILITADPLTYDELIETGYKPQ